MCPAPYVHSSLSTIFIRRTPQLISPVGPRLLLSIVSLVVHHHHRLVLFLAQLSSSLVLRHACRLAQPSSHVRSPRLTSAGRQSDGREWAWACDRAGNLSTPTPLSSAIPATASAKRAKQAQQTERDRLATLLLEEAEAAKRNKVVTMNENVDQLKADREAALKRQLEDEDRAFTLPHIRGALPSESIAFLKWKGGREGQPMWRAWMAGLDELTDCRRRYRTVKRRMILQRDQLLQLRVSEEERRATRSASEDGVEVMDEDEYERYVQLVHAQTAYTADETERVAAKLQLNDCLTRMSELQADMCDTFVAWFDEKYANGKPRQTIDAADRKQRWWQVPAAAVEDRKVRVEEEHKVAEESVGDARVVEVNQEDTSARAAEVQLNLGDVSASKPGSSASAQKKETSTSRSKVSRNTTSRA